MLVAHETFENVKGFKYLGATVTKHNYFHEVIKRRFNSGNVCYNSV
jgi:hypothetical protein